MVKVDVGAEQFESRGRRRRRLAPQRAPEQVAAGESVHVVDASVVAQSKGIRLGLAAL